MVVVGKGCLSLFFVVEKFFFLPSTHDPAFPRAHIPVEIQENIFVFPVACAYVFALRGGPGSFCIFPP